MAKLEELINKNLINVTFNLIETFITMYMF